MNYAITAINMDEPGKEKYGNIYSTCVNYFDNTIQYNTFISISQKGFSIPIYKTLSFIINLLLAIINLLLILMRLHCKGKNR